jgi:hypothetical protein
MFWQPKASALLHTARGHSAGIQGAHESERSPSARVRPATTRIPERPLEHLKLEPASTPILWQTGEMPSWREISLDERARLRVDSGSPEDLAALRALSGLPEPDPLIGRYALLDAQHDDQVVATLTLRGKRRSCCREHTLLSNSNLDSRILTAYRIAAALLLLEACGPGTFGFLSCFAPGQRNRDFECFREALPIWEHVSQEEWLCLAGGHVRVGNLRDWFFQAPCFSSADARALSAIVWKFLEQDPPRWHDLLMAYFSGWYQCIPVQRQASKPLSFSVLHPDEYADFGGLELSGLLSNIRTLAMAKALGDEPTPARQRRLRAAYSEICAFPVAKGGAAVEARA